MNRKALCLIVVAATSACREKTTSPPATDAQTTDAGAAATPPQSAGRTGAPPTTVLPALPNATGKGRFAIATRTESAIEVVIPKQRPKNPPLLIVFHATGEEPENSVAAFDLVEKAEALGFVAIAPRAGYRDGNHSPDVDHPENDGGSSWNMWTPSIEKNEDLSYVRSLIEAAKRSWNADATRVYTAGFSNGAYFSYFVAASMPDRIAGFAENSGGWPTDACPTRYDQDGGSLYLMNANPPAGRELTCATILGDKRLPPKCRVRAANKLRAPTPAARVPFGYLAHYSTDDVVSVAWSCLLGEGLGARAKTLIRAREADGTTGHTVMPDFIPNAFKFFANRTNAQ